MSIQTETFFIRKGNDFNHIITVKQNDVLLDMTNYTFQMQIRKCIDDTAFLIELTDSNGRIDISLAAQGDIILTIDKIDTALLEETKGVFDLRMTDTNLDTTTILQGVVEISQNVTR